MILCDLDMVLATSNGSDTVPGQPIQRTFQTHPYELDLIKSEGIPFHIVTAKVEQEARCVLHAIGLDGYVTSVIGANSLLWPTLWHAFKKRQIPKSISKAFWKNTVRWGDISRKSRRVVMIEDRRSNLLDMLEYGSIDVGILVPQMRLEGESVVEWFDLNLALKLARDITLGTEGTELLSASPLRVYQWPGLGPIVAHSGGLLAGQKTDRHLIELPTLSPMPCQKHNLKLQSFATGKNLVASKGNMVSLLRASKRISDRLRSASHW